MNTPLHIIAVCALVRNERKEILSIRHHRRGWELPGGQVDEGEDLVHALQREVFEETGMLVSNPKLKGVYSNLQTDNFENQKSKPRLILAFTALRVSGQVTTSEESPEVAWLTEEELLFRISQPFTKMRVKDLLKHSEDIVYKAYMAEPFELKSGFDI